MSAPSSLAVLASAPSRTASSIVVPGATHLFPEAGALSQVTDLAVGWFGRHFARTDAIAPAT